MLDEVVDTFDENMEWTGVATRREVHRLGLWHQTFHCWVVHRTTEGDVVILQRRHSSKDTNPNKLDISCAGHLGAGESPADGIRELREELGVEVAFQQLRKLGVVRYSARGAGVQDNEFCHVFVWIREDLRLEEYRPALGEVSGLYSVRMRDFEDVCRAVVDHIAIAGFEQDDAGRQHAATWTLTKGVMVPYPARYYELLFQGMET